MISPDQFGFIPGIWVRVTAGVFPQSQLMAGMVLLDLAAVVDPCIYEHGVVGRHRSVKILLPWDVRVGLSEAPPMYYATRDVLGDILYGAGRSGAQVRAFYRFLARCRDAADLAVELETQIEHQMAKLTFSDVHQHRMYAPLAHPATRSLPHPHVLLH